MSEVVCIEHKIKDKYCLAVKWRNIAIGYVFEVSMGAWLISTDLKGEFWSLESYSSKQVAIDALVQKKQSLDNFRLGQISIKK